MGDESDPIVQVRRQWNDYRIASYRLSQIGGLRWSQYSGGVNAVAPRPFVHGYVLCTEMVDGELAHSCAHGRPPHEILVCMTKKGNEAAWKKVLARLEADTAARRHK